MEYTKEEKTFILNYYLECTDIKQVEFSKKHGFKPFDDYRFYHLAQTYYDKYEDFDYKDKLLCVYAY